MNELELVVGLPLLIICVGFTVTFVFSSIYALNECQTSYEYASTVKVMIFSGVGSILSITWFMGVLLVQNQMVLT